MVQGLWNEPNFPSIGMGPSHSQKQEASLSTLAHSSNPIFVLFLKKNGSISSDFK